MDKQILNWHKQTVLIIIAIIVAIITGYFIYTKATHNWTLFIYSEETEEGNLYLQINDYKNSNDCLYSGYYNVNTEWGAAETAHHYKCGLKCTNDFDLNNFCEKVCDKNGCN